MEGYHGTTECNLNSILTNRKINISKFIISPDLSIRKNQRLVNDLGQGFYLFLSSIDLGFDGKISAEKYAKKFKNDFKAKVLKIKIVDDGRIFDLNDTTNRKLFNQVREKLYTKLNYEYNINIKNDGAKTRANLDGLFIEALIMKHYDGNIDGVICDSYTPYYSKENQLSNIPNGRELCLRNLELIDWDQCEEVS